MKTRRELIAEISQIDYWGRRSRGAAAQTAEKIVDHLIRTGQLTVQAGEPNVDADSGLVIGQRYRIRHRSEHQRRDRISVLTYLGVSYSQDGAEDFSGRPACGTTSMPRSWIKSVEPVERTVQHSVNRLAPSDSA